MARNYKQEYANYQGTPEQKKRRAMRNKVRRQALKDGRVTKGSGFDIHHRDGNPMNTSPNNLVVQHSSQNRSFKRDKNAKKVQLLSFSSVSFHFHGLGFFSHALFLTFFMVHINTPLQYF